MKSGRETLLGGMLAVAVAAIAPPGGASDDMVPNLQDSANPLPLMDIKKVVRTIGGAD